MKLATAIAALGFGLALSGAASATTFAAISYNKETGAYGYSTRYPTQAGAEERAAQECGPGCETLLWVRDACASLATGASHAYGSGWDTDGESAAQTAMNSCSEHADDCSVVVQVCSGE